MTPLPKRRWSTQRQGRRRATIKAGTLQLTKCPKCGHIRPNHAVCSKCGFYNDIKVLTVKEKKSKKATSEE